MVRVPKRASKRQSTKQRVKVQKKVREHHRKTRRDAKKNPQWRSKKKADPGIPNSFPFKEQLLDEIQMKREREEQRKLEERERKIAERKAKKGLIGDDAAADEDEEGDSDEDEAEDEDEGEVDMEDIATSSHPVAAPQYSDSMEHLLADEEISDIVICLDARDPSAWRVPQVETAAKSNGKKVHLAITKVDLVPLESLASHMHALSTTSSASLYPISARSTESVRALVDAIQSGNKKKVSGVAVLGLEHSGRSTLATLVLNLLEGGKVFDTPHLVARVSRPKSDDEDDDDEDNEGEDEDEDEDEDHDDDEDMDEGALDDLTSDITSFDARKSSALHALLRNKGQVHRAKDVLPLIWALLSLTSNSEDLLMLYNVPAFGTYTPSAVPADVASEAEISLHYEREQRTKLFKDAEEFLIGLARVQGRARKHGIPDVHAAARIVLRDWAAGSVGYYSMSKGWNAIPKATRADIVAKYEAQTKDMGVSKRKEWKKDFAQLQKDRRDLHPSPAIGELRLKSAGEGVVAVGSDAATVDRFEFWVPKVVAEREDDEEDEDEDEDVVLGSDDDEELDSDVLVPDSDEDEEEEEEEEEE